MWSGGSSRGQAKRGESHVQRLWFLSIRVVLVISPHFSGRVTACLTAFKSRASAARPSHRRHKWSTYLSNRTWPVGSHEVRARYVTASVGHHPPERFECMV